MGPVPVLFEQLAIHGPWLIFVMAILETCFVTGLLVPSGLATSAATIMVLEGALTFPPVIAAAVTGGFLGDTLGYWIGRAWGRHLLHEEGRWSRMLGSRRQELDEMFGRHPFFSVTTARLISFVRTVMPMGAGMSGMPYVRYLPFELVGLLLWCAIYVTIGFAGREGWEAATRLFGVGGTVAFVVAAAIGVSVLRRRARRGRKSS